jgi:hypothetical protein
MNNLKVAEFIKNIIDKNLSKDALENVLIGYRVRGKYKMGHALIST